MEKLNINIAIAESELGLTQLLAQSQLPIGVVSYILKDYLNNIERQYIGYVNSYYLSKEPEYTKLDPEAEEFRSIKIEEEKQSEV